MSSINKVSTTSNQYLESFLDYVLDVKPYRTKLATIGSVSEEYRFSDSLTVHISDRCNDVVFLGADLLPSVAIPGENRARLSQSWWKDIVSDGSRGSWPMPQITIPVFSSMASLDKFTTGDDDYQGIVGFSKGAYNPKRWDGPGITYVTRNGNHQQDTIHYTLSHGVYSFDVEAGGNWKEHDLINIGAFGTQSGTLFYNDVSLARGMIKNITGGNNEEWIITTTYVDPMGQFPAQASVVGSSSGNIGTVDFNQQFTSSLVHFFWAPAFGETNETTQIGDIWTLTPGNKIVVASSALAETWSIIKSNPIALNGAPIFIPAVTRTDFPAIEIHTRSLDLISEEISWSIIFNGDGTYQLNRSALSNPNNISYPITINLINGCSFKNADIAFTLIPTSTGWNADDTFSWTIGPNVANFKVFGSVSGWQSDAVIGKWYWNGKIGFKIPKLEYFTSPDQIVPFTALSPVRSIAEPSVYIITFITATNGIIPAKATVYNNIYGYREGLIQGQPWADEFTSFQIDSSIFSVQYNVGDVVKIYLAPSFMFSSAAGYEFFPYEIPLYDAGNINYTSALLYNSEFFPMFHSHGTVVWHGTSGTGTPLNSGDSLIIDKAYSSSIRLQIINSSIQYPELAPINDWVPLHLKYFDAVNSTPVNSQYTPISIAEFSDLAIYAQAYSAADPSRLIFSITNPRYQKTDRAASSQLTFDSNFFSTYLPFNTSYSLRYEPDEVYGQKIRVKITENLKIFANIYLILAEGPNSSNISTPNGYYVYEYDFDSMSFFLRQQVQAPLDNLPDLQYQSTYSILDSQNIHINESIFDTTNTNFVEGGAFPVSGGFDWFPFDNENYDSGYPGGIIEAIGFPSNITVLDNRTPVQQPVQVTTIIIGGQSVSAKFVYAPTIPSGSIFPLSPAIGQTFFITHGNNIGYWVWNNSTWIGPLNSITVPFPAQAPVKTVFMTEEESPSPDPSNTLINEGLDISAIIVASQTVNVSGFASSRSSPTGLYDSINFTIPAGRMYSATITIDGVGHSVLVQAINVELYGPLIDAIQASIGSTGTIILEAGNIVIFSATTGINSSVSIIDQISPNPLFSNLQGYVAINSEISSFIKVSSLVFDFLILEPLGWTPPPSSGRHNFGLHVQESATEYDIAMINRQTTGSPTLIIESDSNLGVFITQSITSTGTNSFTFNQTGFTAPFRMWII